MGLIDAQVQSDDPDEALRLLRTVYPIADFHETARPFSYSHHVRGDDRAVLAHFAVESWASIQVDFADTFGIGRVVAGRYSAASNGEPMDVTRPFLFRPGLGTSQSEQLQIEMVNLTGTHFARFAGDSLGVAHARVRTAHTAPRGQDAAQSWSRTVDFVRDPVTDPDLLQNDLLRRAAVDILFAAALSTFPLEVAGTQISGADGATLPSTVRRALAYIDEHSAEAIGLPEIAEAARLSVRGLQAAFRRHLDSSPMAELRRARMSKAHAELRDAEPGSTRVQAIARKWGFVHLGRFAVEYRAEFGESPRQTLER